MQDYSVTYICMPVEVKMAPISLAWPDRYIFTGRYRFQYKCP